MSLAILHKKGFTNTMIGSAEFFNQESKEASGSGTSGGTIGGTTIGSITIGGTTIGNIRAVSASPTTVKQRASNVLKEKYPNYKIIVLNDDHNTFEHVVKTLTTYIPGVNSDQAWDFADKIHNEGQAIVWTGPLEQAELYHSQLIRAGLTMAPLEKA